MDTLLNSSKSYEQKLLSGLVSNYTELELSKDDFHDPHHSEIYETLLKMHEEGMAIDLYNLGTKLKGKESFSTVIGLTDVFCSSAEIPYLSEQVKKYSVLRKLVLLGQNVATKAVSSDKPEEIIDNINKEVSSYYVTSKNEVSTSRQVANSVLEQIKNLKENPVYVVGVTTGFPKLDEKLSGLHKTDLIILAARPARGKSSFALQLAKNVALYGKTPVMFFSLEMGNEQLVQRLIASESKVELGKLRTGNLTDLEMQAVETSSEIISSIPLVFNDKTGVSVKDIRQQLKAYNARNPKIGLVIIDYLQLMAIGAKDNMVTAVTEISRGLKTIAKEFNIPVIALSQLSRNVEARGDRPRLSDLRDSGSIEQDADIVMFLHSQKSEESTYGIKNIELLIEKHRNGPLAELKYEFNGAKMWFNEVNDFNEW